MSAIEWTDKTWNPVKGCDKVSPGCKHCYAETFAERWRGTPGHPYEQGFDLRLAPHKLHEPLTWTQPAMVFVNSMSDLFHAEIPTGYINDVLTVMEYARWHTFQVLTKRSDLLLSAVRSGMGRFKDEAFSHVWWGVSVEDRKYGIPRIDQLRQCKVGTRFLSIEPLLEDLGPLDLRGIEWVIVGGESGPGARPMRPEWVRSIRDQCEAQGVNFFFKQWGKWVYYDQMADEQARIIDAAGEVNRRQPYRLGKKDAGRLLDDVIHDAMPDRPVVPLPSHAERKALVADAKGWAREWEGSPLTQIRARS